MESAPLPKTMRRIRIGEAQSPVGSALIDQAKRDQGFDSPMLHKKTLQIKVCKVFFVLIFQSFRVCRYCTAALGILLKGFLLPRAIPPICFRRAIHAWRILREFYD